MTSTRPPARRTERTSHLRLVAALLLTAAAIGAFWLSWRMAAVRPAPQPGPSPAASQRPPEESTTLDFDLLTPPSADPVRIEVPARKRLKVRLAHRAPAADYVWSLNSAIYNVKEIGFHGVHELSFASASCFVPRVEAAWRNLVSVFEEELAPLRLDELTAALAGTPDSPACRLIRQNVATAMRYAAQVEIAGGMGLAPGGTARITVVKRDQATGQPLKTWTLQLEAAGPEPGWEFPTEEAWLVAETARDIAALSLASNGAAPKPLKVRVTNEAGSTTLTVEATGRVVAEAVPVDLSGSVWSPAAYLALARTLTEARAKGESAEDSQGTRAAEESKLLEALLDAESTTLLREGQVLSTRLARAPLDGALNEQAALLLSAFALAEAAGPYSDVRRELCAITAHLALADAIGPGAPPGAGRLVATTALDVLAGREKPALDCLKRLDGRGPGRAAVAAWSRALRLRVTKDWRLLSNPTGASLLERREHLRALVASLGDLEGAAVAFSAEGPPPTWALRLLATDDPSVETGSMLRDVLPGAEVAETAATLGPFGAGPAVPNEQLVRAVGQAPTERFVDGHPLEVLPRALWAARAQRHLANAVRIADVAFANQGLPAAGRDLRQRAAALQPLPLARVVLQIAQAAARGVGKVESPQESESCRAIAREMQQRPMLYAAGIWDDVLHACFGQRLTGQMPLWTQWFWPAIPRGSAHEAERRLRVQDVPERCSNDEVEALRKLVIFEPMVFSLSVKRRFAREPNGADFARELGAVARYSRPALTSWDRAERDNEAGRLEPLRRLCDLRADDCLTLGQYLAHHERAGEAVRAFERAREHARDRVGFSNRIGWLAHYHLDRGDKARAQAVANEAAEVGSGAGMELLGQIKERLGDLDAAEQQYKAIAERYQSPWMLNSFYVRRAHRDAGGRFTARADAARRALFPDGFAQVITADLVAESRRPGYATRVTGLRLSETLLGFYLRRMGLRVGDLIAALNDVRIRTYEQFECVLSLSDEPQVRLVVWRDGSYQEFKGAIPRSRYRAVR